MLSYGDAHAAVILRMRSSRRSKTVTTFLAWTAEPHMEARKRMGLQVFVFLILFTGLMYFTKKKVWADAH